jgi:hypothetical protein
MVYIPECKHQRPRCDITWLYLTNHEIEHEAWDWTRSVRVNTKRESEHEAWEWTRSVRVNTKREIEHEAWDLRVHSHASCSISRFVFNLTLRVHSHASCSLSRFVFTLTLRGVNTKRESEHEAWDWTRSVRVNTQRESVTLRVRLFNCLTCNTVV